ncbi:hypothetical protein NIES37_68490 [Tolypothrix tenuis PCC 7101]|uniref:DUF2811 domain-containing protein n=1 Tax=Tolypothrix tenuis PCC 7101 TaxID=231146 RepID=A0A1Z4NAX7_9CYAN|nr:DUF2811 domain-containing protein [Aulosira sp. FACHB-113]BAZ02836.1 hypothetical protein NIES37_68490 [Tolypothrix tenuis PCC 7101]BAZ78270.1 hypothetical protein NIES50_69030 [Aulosira laxa NIES-50]
MNATVSIFTEIPSPLHECLQDYLQQHPDWDENRLLTAAVSLFLLQNADSDRLVAQVYLDALFQRP